MTESIVASAVGHDIMRLEATRAMDTDADALCRSLTNPGWLGQLVTGPAGRPDVIRVRTDLAFTLPSEGRVLTFRKAALVDIGLTHRGLDGCAGEIGWRAASFAPLFPVFAGRLTVQPSRLHLEGAYAPPGGGVGLLIDRVLLHYVAQRTAKWFLDRLVAELERAHNLEPQTVG